MASPKCIITSLLGGAMFFIIVGAIIVGAVIVKVLENRGII